jgi:hypothetical protein
MHPTLGQGRLSSRGTMLVLAACLSACTSWRVQHATPEQVIRQDQPSKLRVVRTDSVRLVLSQPHISGDSLVGTLNRAEVGIPLSEVSSVAQRKSDVAKSIGLGLAVSAVALGVLYAVSCGDTEWC